MKETLPKGIVTNTKSVTENIRTIDNVLLEDIYRLWRVYTTNKTFLPNHVGRRLENLFWRILGCDRVHRHLTGSAIAKVFLSISEGDNPVPIPKWARDRALAQRSQPSRPPGPKATVSENNHHNSTSHRPSDSQSHKPTLPPPILKKRGSNRESAKTARILSPGPISRQYVSTEPPALVREATKPVPKVQVQPAGAIQDTTKNSSTVQDRNSIPRLRIDPSHLSSSNEAESPFSPAEDDDDYEDEDESTEEAEAFSDPHSSSSDRTIRPSRFSEDFPPSGASLVESDFRSRFQDKLRQNSFSGSTSSGTTISEHIAAATTSSSSAKPGFRRPSSVSLGKAKLSVGTGSALPDATVDGTIEAHGATDHHADESELQRTKSQLSLLLERDRQHGKAPERKFRRSSSGN